jgi:acylphosphatase
MDNGVHNAKTHRSCFWKSTDDGLQVQVVTIARAFDLKGYVKNLPDGRVKVLAEGSDADLERFVKAIKIENALIK